LLISLAALLAPCFGAKTSVSPVQKVIQLLDDFKTKVEAEGKASTDDFGQYAKWCDDEADAKTHAIEETNVEVGNLKAAISEAEGTITTLTTHIEELTGAISATEAELSKATSGREEGKGTFETAEEELSDTVSTLGHDYTLIKKEMAGAASFAQVAASNSKVSQIVDRLKKIVEANWVTTHDKKAVSAFLQQKADAEDAAEDLQAPAAYQSSSGGILDTISDMEEKAEDSLGSERKQEMKDQQAFELLKLALSNELKGLREELAKATSKKQFTVGELASSQKALAAAEKGLAEDTAYLKDLKHECQEKASTFEEEYKDRQAELAVLDKAKGILAAKFSFLQTSVRVRVSSHMHSLERENDERKEEALKLIHKLGKSLGSTVLVSLSYRALADPFAKVKGMIEDMISKLLQEAAEEASHKAFCDKEMGESKASMKSKSRKLDTVNARIEKSEATIQTLMGETASLNEEISETDKAMADATAIRTSEKASFEATAKDLSESQEACAAAIEVLRGYYESGSFFLQMRSKTRAKARAALDMEESTGDGSAIIGLLEVAESDFSKLLAEAKAGEETAQEEFARMATDAKVLKATKSAEVKGKNTQVASIKATLMEYSSDKDGLSKELDAVMEYLDKLKPQCETKVPSYEERAARREKEITGLKEGLEILSGDGVPVL